MEEKIVIEVIGKTFVEGCGIILSANLPNLLSFFDLGDLIERKVEYEGKKYTIRSVEYFRGMGPPKKNQPYGLIVRELK